MRDEELERQLYQKAGRMGALALNSDPKKKSAAARKAAKTRKKLNPNIFVEMGRKGGSTRKKNSKEKTNKTRGD